MKTIVEIIKSNISICLFVALTAMFSPCHAQQNTPQVAISPTKMNVLYAGIANPVNIAVSGIPNNELRIECFGGDFFENEGKTVIIPFIYSEENTNCKIKVYHKDSLLGKVTFRVKKIPEPRAKVAGKSFGEIKKDELLATEKLMAELENFDFDVSYEIIYFSVSATIRGLMREYPTYGDMITESQKGLIKNLPTGSKVYFEDIIVKGPGGLARNLPAIILKVVEE